MNDQDDRITILLVDDHALVREGLREILETQPDMRVVGEAEDSGTTVALAGDRQPDVILLDIEIPGGEVTATVNQIRSCSAGSRRPAWAPSRTRTCPSSAWCRSSIPSAISAARRSSR